MHNEHKEKREDDRAYALMDRPYQPNDYELYHDSRMPREWNKAVSEVRSHPQPKEMVLWYRNATPNEVSKPTPFNRMSKQIHTVDMARVSPIRAPLRKERPGEERRTTKGETVPAIGTKERQSNTKQGGKKQIGRYIDEDIPTLRDKWKEGYQDIMNGTPETLPPFRRVNHEINLVDEGKQYHYHLPRCPRSMYDQLSAKIEKYVRAGWWEPLAHVTQAALMRK